MKQQVNQMIRERVESGKQIYVAPKYEDRAAFINVLWDNGFEPIKMDESSLEFLATSHLPFAIDVSNRKFWGMGNVTCAAAAIEDGVVVKEGEFIEYLGAVKKTYSRQHAKASSSHLRCLRLGVESRL
jgi:hypothetical protein